MKVLDIAKLVQEAYPGTSLDTTKDNYEILDRDGDCSIRIKKNLKINKVNGRTFLRSVYVIVWPCWLIDLAEKYGFDYDMKEKFFDLMRNGVILVRITLESIKDKALVKRHFKVISTVSEAFGL